MFVLYTYEFQLVLFIIDLCLSQTDNQQKFHPNTLSLSLSHFTFYLIYLNLCRSLSKFSN